MPYFLMATLVLFGRLIAKGRLFRPRCLDSYSDEKPVWRYPRFRFRFEHRCDVRREPDWSLPAVGSESSQGVRESRQTKPDATLALNWP